MNDTNNDGTLTSVRREEGLCFSAVVRGHTIVMDQPASNGGADTAASPMELLGASLGACAALYIHQFCAARGIPDDDLRVDVVTENARKPYRVGRFLIRVTLPAALPPEYREAAERAVRTCPVHNTLLHPPVIDLELADAEQAEGVHRLVEGAAGVHR